ncbi:MAG: ATP-binding protein [Holosporaceae bacterium]|nr:MAG: ATP-binding protein [Holosporaceae bacterium]
MKTISVSAEDTKKHTALMIEDTGPGFPEELQQNILDPYVTTKEKGTGLGLSIVKRIMEDHDGTLSFENQKRK